MANAEKVVGLYPSLVTDEYQIAVDVFGRPETFDPRIDFTVRAQTSRLRKKLIEYYATTGTRDSLVIEIRGAYSAAFHWRSADLSHFRFQLRRAKPRFRPKRWTKPHRCG